MHTYATLIDRKTFCEVPTDFCWMDDCAPCIGLCREFQGLGDALSLDAIHHSDMVSGACDETSWRNGFSFCGMSSLTEKVTRLQQSRLEEEQGILDQLAHNLMLVTAFSVGRTRSR
jgi:hypothetical protein